MLEQFFSGVLRQLQAEVDLVNSLVPHHVTKGTLNEESLRRVLAAFLPKRYELGAGFVIDSFSNRSNQVDIIIYDSVYYSKLFNSFSQVLFPVETVFACIEVKTTLTRSGLTEIGSENKAINQLKHYSNMLRKLSVSQTTSNTMEYSEIITRPPLTFVVTFHTGTDNPVTIRKWFEESQEKEDLPDMVLFLDLALVVFRPNPMDKTHFNFLLMPLREIDVGGIEKKILYCTEPRTPIQIAGHTYYSSTWKGKSGYPALMPEKALLHFLVQLTRAMDHFPKHDSFDPSPYLNMYSAEGLDVL